MAPGAAVAGAGVPNRLPPVEAGAPKPVKAGLGAEVEPKRPPVGAGADVAGAPNKEGVVVAGFGAPNKEGAVDVGAAPNSGAEVAGCEVAAG